MALRLVRQTSETPNITNKDDTIMTRYAYGGYNGIVKAFGSECGYSTDNGNFKVLDGRIVLDGWEIDIDGAGVVLDLTSLSGFQYYSIYLEVNILTETAEIKSSYLTGTYPEIEKGDDLTEVPNGTARLLLYNVKVENGIIKEVVKKFSIIPYLAQKVIDLNKDVTDLTKSVDRFREDFNETTEPLNQYDKNKGTIEERLTKLGFNRGSVVSASASTTIGSITRQGNYCILNCKVDDIGAYDNNKEHNVMIGQTASSNILNFFPINEVECFAYVDTFSYPSTSKTVLKVNINASGEIYITIPRLSSASVSSSIQYTNFELKNIGYEAIPL